MCRGMVGLSEIRASVLQLQGTEFCQQPVSLETELKPHEIIVTTDTLISAWETLSKGPSYSVCRPLTHGSCEMINVCC